MKKILILSYHFPPMNVIASQRSLGYVEHFKKFGLEPTIVTFDWNKKNENQYCNKKNFNTEITTEENSKFIVYRLPIIKHKRSKLLGSILNSRLSKFGVLFSWLFGHLDSSEPLLDYKLSERKFLNSHLKSNKYDVILGIFSPHFHLSNCFWANKKFGINYSLDYRDLWDNRLLHKDYNATLVNRIQDKLTSYYWKKWSSNSLFQTIPGKIASDIIEEVTNKKTHVIFNGFEPSDSKNIKSFQSDYFEVLHTGSIYNHQEFKPFFDGVRDFVKDVKPDRFKIIFLGAKRSRQPKELNSIILPEDIMEYWQDISEYVSFTERVSRTKVMEHTKRASILYLPSFPSAPGTYGGKIFEYLDSKKPILMVPKDDSVLDELVSTTETGVSLSKPSEINKYLTENYRKWKSYSPIVYKGNSFEIEKYSRENQTKCLAKLIKNELN